VIKIGDTLRIVIEETIRFKNIRFADDAVYVNRVAYKFELQKVTQIIRKCKCGEFFDASQRKKQHMGRCKKCESGLYMKSLRKIEHQLMNEKAERSCLMCGKKFASRGPHNRRCSKCSSMAEHLGEHIQYKPVIKVGLL
jgi:hypothetical protein